MNPLKSKAGKAGRAASPWGKHPHCTGARAQKMFREGQRLRLIAEAVARVQKKKAVQL